MAADRDGLQARLRSLFLDELAENVVILNRGLVALEQDRETAEAGALVDEMFRAAHSLKGAAHSAGVPELVGLCHHLEDALGRFRDGTAPPGALFSPLLRGVDALEAAGGRMRRGEGAGGADVTGAERALISADVDAPPGPATTARREEGAVPRSRLPTPGTASEEARATRAPADGSIRVAADRLDALLNQAGELLLACGQVDALAVSLREAAATIGRVRTSTTSTSPPDSETLRAATDRVNELARAASATSQRLAGLSAGLAAGVRRVRMTDLGDAYVGLERVARDLASSVGKDISLVLDLGDVEVDRPIVEATADALHHLLRNAIDHGIETPIQRVAAGKPTTGTITVSSNLELEGVAVRVADDGRGMDRDALTAAAARRGIDLPDDESMVAEVAFLPGVSTAPTITELSGRGVGLDAVRARVEGVGGSVRMSSTPGQGCTVSLLMPLALSAIRVLLVTAAGETFALASAGLSPATGGSC